MEKKYEDEIFVIAADCTGHGVPGAIMSVICTNALNEVVINQGHRETHKILDEVRNNVVSILNTEQAGSQKDGMDVSLCRVNKKTGAIQFTGAHNPLWILRKDTDEFEVIKGDKQPVGYYENAHPFTAKTDQLNEGDRIYLFSDGFQDQFGGAKGKKFKAANMKKLFIEHKNQPISEQAPFIQKAFDEWKGDLEQVDDVVLIGIEF